MSGYECMRDMCALHASASSLVPTPHCHRYVVQARNFKTIIHEQRLRWQGEALKGEQGAWYVSFVSGMGLPWFH
jgi:hypothetical protein